MARDWESVFNTWSAGPGKTEQEKLENAENAIRKAIGASSKLSDRSIRVFAKGSYANRTNVRQESDVDVCVLYDGAFYYDFAQGVTAQDVGVGNAADYRFAEFKNDVGAALTSYFRSGVTRGNKAFDIHENTYRVSADAVACFEYRYYDAKSPTAFRTGTCFFPDDGSSRVINWPEQQYANGVAKNDRTKKRYKAITRVFKNMRNEMADAKNPAAIPIPSYLIECLVYRTPDNTFGNSRLYDDVRGVIVDNWNGTGTDEDCKGWTEVNENKYLFGSHQPWSRDQVRAFLQAAWTYGEFK